MGAFRHYAAHDPLAAATVGAGHFAAQIILRIDSNYAGFDGRKTCVHDCLPFSADATFKGVKRIPT
jgi:hypothetical protein